MATQTTLLDTGIILPVEKKEESINNNEQKNDLNAVVEKQNPVVCEAKPRTKCEIWTRVMGYHRPVSHFNIGKKGEYYSRKFFTEVVSANSEFCAQYAAA